MPPIIIMLSNFGIKFLITFILEEIFEPPIMHVTGLFISDVTLFNFKKEGKAIIEYWIDMFLSHRAFKERRWDDGYILEITRQHLESNYSFGQLRSGRFDIYRYILHYKGTNIDLRKEKPGI